MRSAQIRDVKLREAALLAAKSTSLSIAEGAGRVTRVRPGDHKDGGQNWSQLRGGLITHLSCVTIGTMVRAQIVLDESTIDRLRAASAANETSMSQIVRQALDLYFENREPDTSWIGSLKPKGKVSHAPKDIRSSLEAARRRGAR